MAAKRLLIAYYSATGNTGRMAEAIAGGAEVFGVEVVVRRVEECTLDDLVDADGIVVGSPTYFSNVSWQVKKFIDDSIVLYRKERKLRGKVGGCFTSSGTHRDGVDCIKTLELAFGLHHGLNMVPGIIRSSGDRDEEVVKSCQQYGAQIRKKMLL